MEHRWWPRQISNRQVKVIWQGRFLGRYRCINLSKEGMFLQVTDSDIPQGSIIEVEFDSEKGGGGRCRGLVIHSGPAGIGIMCIHCNPLTV